MKIIVGLGNPGSEYENTNHNVGFLVVDDIAKNYGERFTKELCNSKVCSFYINSEKIILVKPQTYMNNSGIAVSAIVKKYKINTETDLIVISDDIDIREGVIRIRKESNSSTHNGIRSIVSCLGTNKFLRVKVSIAPRPEFGNLADYVLSKIKNDSIYNAITKAKDAIIQYIEGEEIDKIINKYSN